MDEPPRPPKPEEAPVEITRLLAEAASGDDEASERVLPVVYKHLRRIAQKKMGDERAGHTLEPTALVHEAYLRLFGEADLAWSSRGEFFFAAARAMRRILIDHARSRGRQKRGGSRRRVPLGLIDLASTDDTENIVALEDAVTRLEKVDERAARVVQFRFYAGLSVEETAEVMELSPRTVVREWDYARAWLSRDLEDAES